MGETPTVPLLPHARARVPLSAAGPIATEKKTLSLDVG